MNGLDYEVANSVHSPSEWVVEAIGSDGEVYVSVFSGPLAEVRAREYANWKFGTPIDERNWYPSWDIDKVWPEAVR